MSENLEKKKLIWNLVFVDTQSKLISADGNNTRRENFDAIAFDDKLTVHYFVAP